MFDLSRSTALITGGTRGIGLAIAHDVLQHGGKVLINGRSPTDEAQQLLDRHGSDRVVLAYADVTEPKTAASLLDEMERRFGGCNVVVHSAGGPAPGRITDLTEADWTDAFKVHVHPVFHLFRAAHPFLSRDGGSVLLISSVAALRGCPGSIAYQTVKGALIPMARALAFDHAPENIRVNVIAPGVIRTRFHQKMTDEARTHNVRNRIPLRREGTTEEVSSLAMELLRNEFVTGEVFTIDGGMSMRITA